jgi:hypothetical protein
MKQEITSEKKKELEFKKSMFNVKIFSLMKKQLFSLVMLLAIMVFAGTSAWAQTGYGVSTAVWHIPGSTHSVTVDASHTGTTYAWVVESINCDSTVKATPSPVPVITAASASTHTAVFTYPADASGMYRFRVTEQTTGTGDAGCSTIREFYTAVMNVDVTVVASNEDGTTTGLELSRCNDYTLRTSFNPAYLVPNTDANDYANNLPDFVSASLFNQRWVHVTLATTDGSGCTVGTTAPAATSFYWMFDYTIAGLQYAGNADADDNNFTGMQPVTSVTYLGATDAINTIGVAAGTAEFTIPLRSNIRWGTTEADRDQHFTFTVSNVHLKSTAPATIGDEALYTDGGESTANQSVGNVSTEQIIHASPATPRITVVD